MLREVDRWKALQKNENFTAGWFNVLDGDLRAMDKLKTALSSASSIKDAEAAVDQFYTEDPSRGERFELPGMNTKVKTNPNGTVKELKPEQVNLFEQHINESVAENENNIKNLKSFFAVGGLDGGRQHSWNLFDMAAQWTSGEKSSVYEERIKQLTELKAQVADLKANPSRAKFDALQDRYAAYMREQGKAWQKISANAEVGAKAVVVTAGIAAATATAIVIGPAIFAATTAYLTGLGVSAVATSGGALLTTTLGSGLTGGTAAVGTGLIANSSTLLNKETAAQYQSTFGTGAYSWQTISNNYAIGNQTGQLVGGNIGAGKILSGLKWTENLANSAKIGNVKLFKDATNVGTTVSSFTTSSGSELLDAVSGNSPNKQLWQRGINIGTGTLAGYLGGRTKLGETWKGDVGIGATTQSISSTANYGFTVEGLNDWLTGVAGDIGSASGGHVVKGINPSNTNYSKFEQAGVNHRKKINNTWETHGKNVEGKLSLDNNGTYQKAKDFWLNKGWDDINPEALQSFTIGTDGSKSISYTANGETREIKVNTDGSGVLTTNGQEVQIPVDQAQGLVELIGKYERAKERQNNLNNRPSPQTPQAPKVQSVNPKTSDGLDINIQQNNPKNNFDYKVQLTDPNNANAVIGELNLSRNLAGQWEIKNISNHSIEINGQPVGNGQALKVGNGDAILLNGHYFRIEGQGPNKGVKLAEIGLVEYQAITNQKQPKAQNNQQSSPQGGNNRVNAPTKTNSGLDIDLQRVSEFDYNLSIKNPDGSVNSSLNLERNHFGQWELRATNNQVSVNGKSANGVKLQNGDVINLNGHFFELKGLGLNKGVQLIEIAEARYNEVSAEKAANAQRRPFQNNQPSRLKVSAQTVEGKDIQFTSKSTFDYEVSIEGNAASIKRNFAGQWQISGNNIAVDGNPVNGSVNLRLNTQPVIEINGNYFTVKDLGVKNGLELESISKADYDQAVANKNLAPPQGGINYNGRVAVPQGAASADFTSDINVFRSQIRVHNINHADQRLRLMVEGYSMHITANDGSTYVLTPFFDPGTIKLQYVEVISSNASKQRIYGPGESLEVLGQKIDLEKIQQQNPNGPFHKQNGIPLEEQLFPNSIKNGKFAQGQIGNCYYHASLDAIRRTSNGEKLIMNMISDDGNGGFNVAFADEEIINIQASDIDPHRRVSGDFGWQVLERAYARYIRIIENLQPGKSVLHVEGRNKVDGEPRKVFEHLFGWAQTRIENQTDFESHLDQIADNPNMLAMASSESGPSHHQVLGNHAYSISSVDKVNKTVTVSNPHNTNSRITLSYDEFKTSYRALTFAVMPSGTTRINN
jgi:hypothetical protein